MLKDIGKIAWNGIKQFVDGNHTLLRIIYEN